MILPIRRTAFVVLLLLACLAGRGEALQSDQILLVVNQNVPESTQVAEFYRNARLLPPGRIVALDLPTGDDISFDAYERQVVPPLRQFIRANHLEQKITCLVTFYGVPLRIGPHLPSAPEKQEIAELQAQEKRLIEEIRQAVGELESQAKAFDGGFHPASGDDFPRLLARADAALPLLLRRLNQTSDQQLRAQRSHEFTEALKKLGGPAALLRAISSSAASNPRLRDLLKPQAEQFKAASEQIARENDHRFDPAARKRVRELVGGEFGLADLIQLIHRQVEYLKDDKTGSALDSELALLWWDYYPRASSVPNPLHYRNPARPANGAAPALMVMRLDAPQPQMVRDMILASLRAERDGLRGQVVIDARGMHADGKPIQPGGYVWYDQGLRDLAALVKTKTKLPSLVDDRPELLPADSASDVALYCGWYSVRKYVPCCRFNGGAVAFHVASYELIHLRDPNETGWCRGLLNAGVAATLGSVAEPYLGAFPPADEFFPLLLTGKLPLAEVYWKTNPAASWMMCMIGDPLYTPYKKNPALAVEDLPARLKPIFEAPATRPASRAGTTLP